MSQFKKVNQIETGRMATPAEQKAAFDKLTKVLQANIDVLKRLVNR